MSKPLQRLVRFSIVGVMNSGIDLSVFALLSYLGTHYLIAQCISFLCGVLNSYTFNRSWTFQQKGKVDKREFTKFFMLNLVVLLFTSWVLSILYTEASLPLLICKLASAVSGAFLNFAGSRLWVFRLSREKKEGIL
ncbi:GtrA family protein [Paenibacillus sp. RC67]|uniref:GtrA family protein n=1 Tax=Paenibacillus sp. RC67 TaxID=3039392 RepID=UPI0024AE72F9|nr:GtrA family protein [Paenibacillus sp. RC67]